MSGNNLPFMNQLKTRLTTLVAVLIAGLAANAQSQISAAGPPGWNAAMTKLFGDIKAFTAKADIRVSDRAGKESIRLPMGFSFLEGKVRLDIDMTEMKGPAASAEAIAGLKQMAMDRMACVVLPEKKSMQIIYPALTGYVEVPLPEEESAALDRNLKTDKTPLGKEAIDGHPCAKNRVTLTDDRGQKLEFIVWNAADLKDFPLQAQMNDKETIVVTRFRAVQFGKPDARHFEAPDGYTRHSDFLRLMQAATQKTSAKSGGKK